MKPRTEQRQRIIDTLVKHFIDTPREQTVTYQDLKRLSEGMEIDGADRWVVYAVRKILMKEHNRTLSCEHNIGYYVPAAKDHGRLAGRQVKLSRRRLQHGHKIAQATEKRELSKDQISALESTMTRIAILEENQRFHSREIAKLAKAMESKQADEKQRAAEDGARAAAMRAPRVSYQIDERSHYLPVL